MQKKNGIIYLLSNSLKTYECHLHFTENSKYFLQFLLSKPQQQKRENFDTNQYYRRKHLLQRFIFYRYGWYEPWSTFTE